MKKIIAVLAAVLMLCAIIPMGALSVSAADNLVPNGTFDSNTSGWGKSTNTVLTLDNGAMKATHADDWAYVYTWFDVTANTDYTISFKAKADKGGFAINFKDNGWAAAGITKLSPAITTEWKEYEMTFNTGSFSGRLLVFFSSNQYGSANQSIWLDDVSVTEYIPLGTAIYQEDFEGASAGAWANSVTTLASSSEFPVANAACGNYAMKMASTYYSYTNYTLTVEKNTTYKVTFSILSATSGYPINARIRTNGSVDLALYQYTPSTTAWETHSYTFNSGENTSVNFRFQAGWETGTYYIDNLSVVTCEEPVNDGHISNGDFEAGNANWIDSANTAVVEDPTGANKGLVMSTNENANVTMFSQTAKNLKPNTYYNLSFNVYGFSTVSTNNSAFWVRFASSITDWTITQSPNGSASANAYTPRINVNTKLNAWYNVNIKFNTGDLTETVINFMNYRTNGGQYYFDDIIVFEDKDPSYDGYIYNGDFECGTTANWSSVSGGITHNAAQVHDGTFALSLYTNGGWGGVGNQTIKNLVVGNEYYVSMWVRSDGAYINGVIQDSIINPDTNKVTTLASFPIRNNYTDWHFYDVKFTATETTATLNFSGPGSTSYAGYGYVDSIKIESVCDHDGHSWTDADCDTPKTCSVCGETEGEALGHAYAESARVDATCGADGSVTYTCGNCGDSYTDVLPATGEHVYFDDCSAICEVCGYEREAGHNVIHVEAKDATCTELGNIEYWYCDVCGMAWLDEACIMNTNMMAVKLPMIDHTYDNDFDADCNACGAVREVAAFPVPEIGKSISEDVNGYAVLFDANVEGLELVDGAADYTNATYEGYKLLGLGVTASNSKSSINIEGERVYGINDETGALQFAFRIINIPADKLDVEITMVPYYIVEIDGVATTIEGEAVVGSYAEIAG